MSALYDIIVERLLVDLSREVIHGRKVFHLKHKPDRVAVELEEEVMVRSDGTITTNNGEQAGRKTKYILTRPEFVFFVDEVGCNTSQKNDGNNGGQKFIVQSGQ